MTIRDILSGGLIQYKKIKLNFPLAVVRESYVGQAESSLIRAE